MAVVLPAVTACDSSKPKDTDPNAAMLAHGYVIAPRILSIEQAGTDTYVVTGQTTGDARVRFTYGGGRAIGVTSDAKGRFRAELPANPAGDIFDLSIESNRPVSAEGRLFIPPGAPSKAVFLRAGSPSRPLFNAGGPVEVIDYDAAGGLAITGKVAPRSAVEVMLNGEIRAQVVSDDAGVYSATSQIPAPQSTESLNTMSVSVARQSVENDFKASLPVVATDHIMRQGNAWRVDWQVPGGGMQTSLVY